MTIRIVARLGRVLFLFLWLPAGLVAAQPEPTPTPPPAASPALTELPTPTASPMPRPADDRFGVIESFEDPTAAGRLRVAWTRARFQWAEVQPDGPRQWEPPLDDETLAAELDAGREVVGLLIGIPDWARDRNGLPRGLSLPADDPDNTWAVFVGQAVRRYAGRIDRWIIWNEPDIDDPDAPGHTWDGDLDDFVQLQRVAYLAAKEANADAAVHLGAFTYFWDPGYFDRFLDAVAADPEAAAHDYYFDAATAHLYFQPNAVYNVLYAFRKVMADHGLDKPLWLVETNAPPMDDPYWIVPNWTLAVSLNEQAAFIPQALAAAISAGAERIAVYKLRDTEADHAANPEPFGLVRWDDSRRPAYNTYRVAIELMAGATAAERERWDAVGQVRLEQPQQTTTVLFARLPGRQTARVPATADTARWIDMWGKAEEIAAEDGVFTVELPGALCLQTIADYCMIGGTTYYLVQANESPRAGQLAATRAAAEAAAATRMATAAATRTATAAPTRTAAAAPTRTATAAPTRTATAAPTPS
ncbi:MAG: hypothetical protein K1X50_21910, partial [Candidatus Promineofilum sp.]|nr:hypothetical protein [Promineifilum sp.]